MRDLLIFIRSLILLSLIFILGFDKLLPIVTDQTDKFFDLTFGHSGDGIEIGVFVLFFAVLIAWGIKQDKKSISDPGKAALMPRWVVRLLGNKSK